MYTTRKQRREYLKNWIKKNPYASKEELKQIKKEIAEMGKKEHQRRTKDLIDRGVIKSKAKEFEVSELFVDEEDFTPDDI